MPVNANATMTPRTLDPEARLAGLLYLVIIGFGLFGELAVRTPLIAVGDAVTTAQNILGAERLFRLGFAADSVMALCDVALAVLLYVLLRPVSPTLALMAATFRLVQTAILGANLLNQYTALLLLKAAPYQDAATALQFLDMHRHGYDLGLLFFGASCLITGWLLVRADYFPRLLGLAVIAAGVVYLAGGYLLFLAPALADGFAPAYAVCLLAEVSLCLWLLVKGASGAHAKPS